MKTVAIGSHAGITFKRGAKHIHPTSIHIVKVNKPQNDSLGSPCSLMLSSIYLGNWE